jgi:8-oxo-dGTP pyrophosphatase MutT (NUDIX family)
MSRTAGHRQFEPQAVRRRLAALDRSAPRRRWRWEGDRSPDMLDDPGQLLDAAVLIPLTLLDGEVHVVFTRRSHDLETHSGEVSFPGGGREPEDEDLLETALREAYEEIALQPQDVDVFGSLVEMPTITGFRISAFVGEFRQPYELQLNPAEIESLFSVPLPTLADPEIHRIEMREWEGDQFPVHFYEYGGYTIWGATGWLVEQLLDFLASEGTQTEERP